jgi:hypothetical protein
MPPDSATANARTPAASTSTTGGRQPDGEHPGHQGKDPAGALAAAATALAGISGTAREGSMDAAAALAAITAARKLAAGLEHGELAFIEAARDGGATWSQIAAAMGARNRQTAQKRHADLARRCPRPPSVDPPAPPESWLQETGHDDRPASTSGPDAGNSPGPARAGKPSKAQDEDWPPSPAVPSPAAPDTASSSPAPPARNQREQTLPTITSAIIGESQYELVRAPGHHETRAWHVLVGGTRVGLVRPTWRGERSRPGWEPVDSTGLALPATGIGRVTTAGNARTRDAAAVSLLRALQRQQENERKRKPSR